MTTILWVNEQTNICENVTLDPRPVSEIQIPGYVLLDIDQVKAFGWQWDENAQDWVTFEMGFGQGAIGDTYANGVLTQPKPEPLAQPVTSGTQDI